ncbi:unnamed protein product [Staurois parvus]|uniref:Uncharacterized protein n=1 Tax=Staurois parvus TaxID=386267 RepID=A0ABN9A8H1_9NEOB|nr:unnamed protein product [Staurois parvus]
MGASGGIGRDGWRTLNGGQWRDWQRRVEASGGIGREWRPVEGLAGRVEDTEWGPVKGLAERGGGH